MEWWYIENHEDYVTDYESACEYAADIYADEWIGEEGLMSLCEARVILIDGYDELEDHCVKYDLHIYDYVDATYYNEYTRERARDAYDNERYDRWKSNR